jgi:hypothetical protein
MSTLSAPAFIDTAGHIEARFEAGHDTVSVMLNQSRASGKIFALRPFFMYRSWEDGPEDKATYQRLALEAYTSGLGEISADSFGDLYAEVWVGKL